MRSVDANILLRVILADDLEQLAIAKDILSGPCMVLPTVLLEVIWTATRREKLDPVNVAKDVRDILALPAMKVIDADAVAWAIDRYAEGGDFGDMLHIALSEGATLFTTFDTDVAKFAEGGRVPVETLRKPSPASPDDAGSPRR